MGETHYFWFCCSSLRRYLPCIQTIIKITLKITLKITIYKINLKIGVASLHHLHLKIGVASLHHLQFKNVSQEKGLFRNNNKKKGLN